MEHQYLVTGEMPEVIASEKEVLHCIDFEGEIYMRQEGRGMLIGTYEKKGVPWSERDTPWDFTHELLPPEPLVQVVHASRRAREPLQTITAVNKNVSTQDAEFLVPSDEGTDPP